MSIAMLSATKCSSSVMFQRESCNGERQLHATHSAWWERNRIDSVESSEK